MRPDCRTRRRSHAFAGLMNCLTELRLVVVCTVRR